MASDPRADAAGILARPAAAASLPRPAPAAGLPRPGGPRRDDTGALVVEHLSIVRPDGRPLLHDASLRVGPGELVLLVGPSGCGKSTLLLLLGGLLETEADHWDVTGRLACGDREIDLATGHGGVGGVVFQNYALFDELDARDNLRIALDHAPPGTAGLTDQLADMLADIDPDQSISACSGGQRQRLAIVRTVLANQPVLLFDEPNSGLDIISSRRLVELIRNLCRTMGKPALIAVHHYEELLPLADRVLVMDPRTARLSALPPQAAAIEQALEEAAGLDETPADGGAALTGTPAGRRRRTRRAGWRAGASRPLAQHLVPALCGRISLAAVRLADHAALYRRRLRHHRLRHHLVRLQLLLLWRPAEVDAA